MRLPELTTPRLRLHLPGPEAASAAVAFVRANKEHLAPWEPPAPPGYEDEAYWRDRFARCQREYENDQSMRLMLRRRTDPDGKIIGTCSFTQFWRGPFQACYLGYSVDANEQGKGIMTEALTAALPFIFGELGFHRVMANYVPTNERSGKLLRRLGFVVEGYARDYLFIAGAWRDHVLTALTTSTPRVPSGR
jgi:ribosomal-protein-alanine N-acetyltransferase